MNIKNKGFKDTFGFALFLLGAGLLIFTFFTAYRVFTNPTTLGGFAELVSPSGGQGVGKILKIAVYPIAGLLLWVMGSVSGRLAKHGLKMYTAKIDSETD